MTRTKGRTAAWALVATATMLIGATQSPAQHAPAAGHTHDGAGQGHLRAQACQDDFEAVVADGRGFGMAFAADQHGYPGPLHIVELRTQLGLTPEQEATARAMLHAVLQESRPKSAALLDAESRLRRLFESGTADDATVRAAVAEVERRHGEVRLVHLLAHLRARDLLTPDQRRIYHRERWPGRAPGQ